MSTKPEQHLKVGDWWYLPQQDKLVKINESGEVTETAELDNLCQKAINYFIINAGRLITRDEILADVWGVRDVSDGRISRVIRVLRVALGDDSREPTYIETIPKRGFRFIAPIAEVILPDPVDLPIPSENITPIEAPPAVQSRFLPLGIAAAVLILATFAFLLLKPNEEKSQSESVPFVRYEAITSLVGLEFDPAVSPDGKYLAFVHQTDGTNRTRLMLQDLATNELKQLAEYDGSISGPAWRYDGEALAFLSNRRGVNCEVRLITFDKNNMQIKTNSELTTCGKKSLSGRLAWSPDGNYIVYPTWVENESNMYLQLFPLHGGAQERLTVPPQTSIGDYAAKFSKNGNYLAFMRYLGDVTAEIWLIDMETRASKKLIHLQGITPFNVDFASGDEQIIFPSNNSTLNSVNIHTLEEKVLVNTESVAHQVFVDNKGKIFVSMGDLRKTNISRVNNPIMTDDLSESLVFHSSRNDSSAVANPNKDGPVAVYSNRSGLPQIWFYYPDGKQVQISKFTKVHQVRNMEFSPNGQMLLVNVGDNIWLFSADKNQIKISPQNKTVLEPSWSSDGKYIFFTSGESGRWRVIRANALSGEQELVSTQMDFYRESPDASYIIFRDSNSENYKLKINSSGKVIELPVSSDSYVHPHFVLRSEHVYYSSIFENNDFSIYAFNFKTNNLKDTKLKISRISRRFTVSSDESFIYLPVGGYGDIDVAEVKID